MTESAVECEECHYKFSLQLAPSSSRPPDFPLILRCPQCGIGSTLGSDVLATPKYTPLMHTFHSSKEIGPKEWAEMIGPVGLLLAAAFLSMPFLKLSFLFYAPGIAIIAVATWACAFISSYLINRHAAGSRTKNQN